MNDVHAQNIFDDLKKLIGKVKPEDIGKVIEVVRGIIDLIGKKKEEPGQPTPPKPPLDPAPLPPAPPENLPPTTPTPAPIEPLSLDGEWLIEGVITNAHLPLVGKMSLNSEAILNVKHEQGKEDLEATLEITKFSLNGINQNIKPGRGIGSGKGKLSGEKIIAGPISVKLNGPLGEMTVAATMEGIVQDSDSDKIGDRVLGNLYFSTIGINLSGTFTGRRIGNRKISPPITPTPEKPKENNPQDIITPQEFGNPSRVKGSTEENFAVPITMKFTHVSREEIRWNSGREPQTEYLIASSDGQNGIKSQTYSGDEFPNEMAEVLSVLPYSIWDDKASSHETSRAWNKHLGFPVYLCVWKVRDGRSKVIGRTPIIRVD